MTSLLDLVFLALGLSGFVALGGGCAIVLVYLWHDRHFSRASRDKDRQAGAGDRERALASSLAVLLGGAVLLVVTVQWLAQHRRQRTGGETARAIGASGADLAPLFPWN